MLKIKINTDSELEINFQKDQLMLNGSPADFNVEEISQGRFHFIYKNKSYTVEVLDTDETGKSLDISVNGSKQHVEVKDDYDVLLQKLGMDKTAGTKMKEVKAPMPGLVLKINVKEGDAIQKGDLLLVLEAMKMENTIKAVGEGVVKKILVQTKQAVDKNQVIMLME
ncbi:MAG: biotin/lipoyl-containing protein [Bacteroidia bacterium]